MVLRYPDNRKAPPHEVLLTFLWGAKELFIVLGMHADAMSLRESGAARWQVDYSSTCTTGALLGNESKSTKFSKYLKSPVAFHLQGTVV